MYPTGASAGATLVEAALEYMSFSPIFGGASVYYLRCHLADIDAFATSCIASHSIVNTTFHPLQAEGCYVFDNPDIAFSTLTALGFNLRQGYYHGPTTSLLGIH